MNLLDSLRSRLFKRQFKRIRDYRKARFPELPEIQLSPEHLANAKLLVDREALLRQLPTQGTVAELGVAGGDFSEKILSISKPKKLWLVDLWSSASERHGEEQHANVLQRFSSEIENGSVAVRHGLSTDVAGEFPDAHFDWIYIDTDHTYHTTLQELRLYAPKIKDGGIIAGDDFTHLSKGSWTRFGVVEAVFQFCMEHNWEIVCLTMELNANPNFAIRRI